jgi:KDO2-lipid IV(A) lauroyltransferase
MKTIKYFLESIIVRIAICFFKCFKIDTASDIGGWVARNIGPTLNITNVARNNIKMAIPEISAEKVEQIIYDMWDNLGRVAAEFIHIFDLSEEEFLKRVKIEGAEHLIGLKEKGGIFFSGHIANWEISPRYPVIQNIKTSLIYRSANNKFVDDIMRQERSKNNVLVIPKGHKAGRKIIETLARGNALAMLVDQKMNDGINVPFFNQPAMTAPAIARLALKFNCDVIPSQVIRVKQANFILKFYPPIKIVKLPDNEQNVYNIMLSVNNMLEKWITEYPGQWFWLHKRWKK